MKLVNAQLIAQKDWYHQQNGNTQGQAEQIDQCVAFIFFQVSVAQFEKVPDDHDVGVVDLVIQK